MSSGPPVNSWPGCPWSVGFAPSFQYLCSGQANPWPAAPLPPPHTQAAPQPQSLFRHVDVVHQPFIECLQDIRAILSALVDEVRLLRQLEERSQDRFDDGLGSFSSGTAVTRGSDWWSSRHEDATCSCRIHGGTQTEQNSNPGRSYIFVPRRDDPIAQPSTVAHEGGTAVPHVSSHSSVDRHVSEQFTVEPHHLTNLSASNMWILTRDLASTLERLRTEEHGQDREDAEQEHLVEHLEHIVGSLPAAVQRVRENAGLSGNIVDMARDLRVSIGVDDVDTNQS